ncbi:MAG TPA: hypothetical protein PKK15_03065 [Kouleothrix sp.]|nr:hypothetical protein [Kouleothrix sp.]
MSLIIVWKQPELERLGKVHRLQGVRIEDLPQRVVRAHCLNCPIKSLLHTAPAQQYTVEAASERLRRKVEDGVVGIDCDDMRNAAPDQSCGETFRVAGAEKRQATWMRAKQSAKLGGIDQAGGAKVGSVFKHKRGAIGAPGTVAAEMYKVEAALHTAKGAAKRLGGGDLGLDIDGDWRVGKFARLDNPFKLAHSIQRLDRQSLAFGPALHKWRCDQGEHA